MFADAWEWFKALSPIWQGFGGGLVIALFNMSGALLILIWRNPSEIQLDAALGFAAGIMLTASYTSLILPGIEAGGLIPVVIGMILGVFMLNRADTWVPHVHMMVTGKQRDDASAGGSSNRVASVILFIVAITMHNMPEGLAVGVGFGSGDLANAIPLMLAIGIQNIPEGFAVAIASRKAGMGSLSYAAITGIRSGLVEIPLALFGAWAVSIAAPILPYAMGFAAGGMLYVILDEIIPETHINGHEQAATMGAMAGAIIMLILDVSLG